MARGRRTSSFGTGRSVLLPSTGGSRRSARRRRASGPMYGGGGGGGGGPRRRRSRGGRGPRLRRTRGGGGLAAALIGLAALAALGVAIGYGVSAVRGTGKADRTAAAQRFVAAWARDDRAAMWRALTPAARERYSQAQFAELYDQAMRGAGAAAVRTGKLPVVRDDKLAVPVAVPTRRFGTLRGTVTLPLRGEKETAGVAWTPALRLPGLRAGERVRTSVGASPTPGRLLTAGGGDLDADALGASIAGKAAAGGKPATGLRRIHESRLAGRASARLLFGTRTIREVKRVAARSVATTIRPGLQRVAASALGDRLGGVAVIRPSDGAVQALAGIAVSAPQPPGSTFKIVTLSAALASGKATPSSSYPVRSFATLSGTKLRNAGNESCGGALPTAFADSCNSVFAPLGAEVGAKRLVSTAEAFGFNERLTTVPAVKASTIPAAGDLEDALAVGASAIGQDRDLATPLEMASVGATIANGGRRVRPRLATIDRRVVKRAVSAKVADQVRTMMLGVVSSGTGRAAALPGVQVAGKTGTAELRPNAGSDPSATDAWFVCFAPADKPKVAVAVLLVGAGAGGATAAPIARQVLQAAL